MSRRNISKKRFPQPDSMYNSYLVSLLISRILKSGKKNLAKNIVYQAFEIISKKTDQDPLAVFEKAIQNASPLVEVKARRVGGSTYQVPVEVRPDRKISLGIKWMIKYARLRGEKTMEDRLAAEIIAASKGEGAAVKKKDDTHRMAEANKAFSHFRF